MVCCVLQLKDKEILVSSFWYYDGEKVGHVSFWDLNNYTEQRTIKGYYSFCMIELSNGDIAISSNNDPYPIVIIDSSSYQQIKKEIIFEEYIDFSSSLCVFNEHSLTFIHLCF